jgi:hypothetical protein
MNLFTVRQQWKIFWKNRQLSTNSALASLSDIFPISWDTGFIGRLSDMLGWAGDFGHLSNK